jgi:hypothetical protein
MHIGRIQQDIFMGLPKLNPMRVAGFSRGLMKEKEKQQRILLSQRLGSFGCKLPHKGMAILVIVVVAVAVAVAVAHDVCTIAVIRTRSFLDTHFSFL